MKDCTTRGGGGGEGGGGPREDAQAPSHRARSRRGAPVKKNVSTRGGGGVIVKMLQTCKLVIILAISCSLSTGCSAIGSAESGGRTKFGLYVVRSPETTIAPIGDEVVLECGLSVNPDRIVWRFLPQNASKEHRQNFRIIESNSADYNISLNERSSNLGIIVNANTVGEYQCIAWYGASALASVAGQLILASIHLPGKEQRRIDRFGVSPGNTVVLNCGDVQSNPPAVWKYWRNNSLIYPDDQVADNGVLVLNKVREWDSGVYSCSAINSITSTSIDMPTKTAITVGPTPKGPPRFLATPPEVVKSRLGKKATLFCPGIGNPVPKIIWSRDRGNITGERIRVTNFGLEISRVEYSDQGFYHCSVDNGIGPQLRHSVELRVLEAPQIIKGPINTLTNETHDLMMDCTAIGNPTPKISWYINGENVAWDPKIRVTGPTIYIESVEKTHAGMIQCFAKNEAGEVNEANLLQVNPKQIYSGSGGAPMVSVTDPTKMNFDHEGKEKKKTKHRKFSETIMIPPSRPSVTRLSDESVMVRWSANSEDGLPIQFFKVQYRMIGNTNNSIPRGQWMTSSEDIPPHVRSYEVKELKPDHFYRFRIAAVYSNNDNKLGAISGKFHLQRASQLSPSKSHLVVPILQRVEGVSETEIRFVWSLPNHIGTSIEGFYAYFRPASTAGEYSKATIDGMDTREFTLNHLEPGTSYEFKLQSFTASAASDFSAILTGKTISPLVQETPEDSTVIEDTKPTPQPNYIVIVAVSVLGVIVALIIGFCVCKKCRQTRDDATESKTHPADIPENNGFGNSLHKNNNHNRSINITSNPLAADSDKNRNVMELRFLPNANNTANHSVGLVPPHAVPNNHAHQPNHVMYNNNHLHNNNLHFVDGLPRRTLERGLPRNALGGSGNSGLGIGVPTMNIGIPVNLGPTIVNDIHPNSSLRMPGRRNSGSNNVPVPSSPRMIRNGISAELLHQHQHRSPLPKRAPLIGGGGGNNLKRNGIRNEPMTSGSIEV